MGIASIASRNHLIKIACLLILCTQFPYSAAEDILLYRLKKLRDSFLTQINDQLANNEHLVQASYLETVNQLVMKFGETQRVAVEQIDPVVQDFQNRTDECESKLPVKPKDLFVLAEQYLNECLAEVGGLSDSLSAYVIINFEDYQMRATELSLWFMDSYLSDFEQIFSADHYNDVYNELAEQVVKWDNVGSISMYKVRLESLRLLAEISAAFVQDCSTRTIDFIAEQRELIYITALKLCR